MIGLGTGINSVEEFNRRAQIALKDVNFGHFNSSESVFQGFQIQLARGAVSPKMQQAIFNIVHRVRKQISDKLVTDYAAVRAKGAD